MEHVYYLVIDGKKCGPFRKYELIDAGLERDSLVWYQGREDWVAAEKLVGLEELLREVRKARKARRKIARELAQLPLPEELHKLSRLGFMVNIPAGVLYVLGTTLLVTAAVLYLVNLGGPPPAPPPSRGLSIATMVTGVLGLATTVLGVLLLLFELGVLASFTWKCRRIVRILSPRGDKMQIEVQTFVQDLLDLGGDMTGGVDAGSNMPFLLMAILGPGGGAVLIVMCVVCGSMVTILMTFLAVLAVVSIFAAIFLVPYIPLGFSIYRLGFGLNRIVNDCKINAPWAPVVLAFWVALCGILLVFGPLSVPFFILAPIWLNKTTATAVAICEQRTEAVEGPAAPSAPAPPLSDPRKDVSDQYMA